MTTKTVLTTTCTKDTKNVWVRGLTIFVISFIVSPVHAGQTEALAAPQLLVDLPADFDGPAPPISPAVITRDESGRATIRAVRVTTPMRIDGRLDESLYTSVPPISDFIQQEPQEGSPATEKTEVWLAFDDDNVYVSYRCWESNPERMIANEMRRDGPNMWMGNDIVSLMFDTFHDGRNSFNFTTNALGGRQDGQVTNERQWNGDWNTVWDARAGRFEGGWTAEVVIPFKSLRYGPGRDADLGLQRISHQPMEERDLLHHAHSGRARAVGALPGIARRDGCGTGGAIRSQKPRAQALRHFRPEDRSRGHAACLERPRWRHRARREVWADAERHRGLHLQH